MYWIPFLTYKKQKYNLLLQNIAFLFTFITWTASDFVGYSPETYANGIIAWQYPNVATFVGGIQITF